MTSRALVLALLVWQASAYQAPGTHPVTGRKIAGVMGMSGADWLTRPERETEEQPEKALDALKLQPGMVVADIGAGVGYMSLRMAKRVGLQARSTPTICNRKCSRNCARMPRKPKSPML